jgi:ABC-type transport system involved in multi-copper enzyme maturation permease subunit
VNRSWLPFVALVRREVVSTLRKGSTFVLLSLFVGIAIAWLAMVWPEAGMATASDFANSLFRSMSIFLLVCAAAVLPAIGATSIASEREQDTLDVLQTALVPLPMIFSAKLFSTGAFFLLMIFAVLPILATPFFLVGIDPIFMLTTTMVVMVSATMYSTIGVAISCYFRRSTIAVAAALGFSIAYSLIPCFSPLYMVGSDTSGWPVLVYLLIFILANVFLLNLLLAMGIQQLRRDVPPPRYERVRAIKDPEALRHRRQTFPYYIIDPLAAKKPIEDNRNPVFVREIRWGYSFYATVLVRVSYVAAIIFMLMSFASMEDNTSISPRLLACLHGLAVVFAPSLVANMLTKERELGNLDMLRSTLLSAEQAFFGKLGAGYVAVAPMLFCFLAISLVCYFPTATPFIMIATSAGTLILCVALGLTVGMIASLVSTTSTAALILANLLSGVLFLGPSIVQSVQQRIYGRTSAQFASNLFISPPFHFLSMWTRGRGGDVLRMPIVDWTMNTVIYSALLVILIGLALERYRHSYLRDR